LRKQGYSNQTYPILKTAYYNKPTTYQQASYGVKVTQAARMGNVQKTSELIKCGLSSNPCNKFGESLAHIICRRGKSRNAFELLKQLRQLGASFQICDDFGRTPLHDACWTVEPCFQSISLLMDTDINLLQMEDSRGSTPLDYVEKRNHKLFIEFLLREKDNYWPQRKEDETPCPPKLATLPPHSRITPDPINAMPLETASMVSSGEIEIEDIQTLPSKSQNLQRKRNITFPVPHNIPKRRKKLIDTFS